MNVKEAAAIMQATRMAFGNALGKAIRKTGTTQSQLAKEADASPANISRLLGGHGNPTVTLYTKLAYALGYRVRVTLIKIEDWEDDE